MLPSELACPRCGGGLAACDNTILCRRCGARYPVVNGVPDFRLNRSFYAGPASRESITSILQRETDTSWVSAVRSIVAMLDGRSIQYQDLVGAICHPWTMLMGLDERSRVLEVQCGTGGATVALARHAVHVFAMDMTLENLELAKIRLSDHALREKVTPIAAGDMRRLPFRDASIDYVTLVGALERAATYGDATDAEPPFPSSDTGALATRRTPTDIQLRLLTEVFRVLKPGGRLFLASENRFYYNYFGRVRDNITGLWGISLLPRAVANLYSVALTGRKYRSYSYSASAYLTLLRRAGFAIRDTYTLSPEVLGIKEVRSISNKPRIWIQDVAAVYGFRVIKGFDAANVNPDKMLSKTVLSRLYDARGITCNKIAASANRKLILFAKMHGRKVIVKVPLSREVEARAKCNYAFLKYLSGARTGTSYAPTAIAHGRECNYKYYVESFTPGRPLRRVLSKNSYGLWLSAISIFLDWLNPGVGETDTLRDRQLLSVDDEPYWSRIVAMSVRLGSKLACPDLTAMALNRARALLHGLHFRGAAIQGDLNVDNIMVERGRVRSVIDWDNASWNDLPIFNEIDFIKCASEYLEPSTAPLDRIRRLATWGGLTDRERRFLTSRYRKYGIDPSFHYGLVYLYWMQQSADRIAGPLAYDAGKLHERYVVILENFVRSGVEMSADRSLRAPAKSIADSNDGK